MKKIKKIIKWYQQSFSDCIFFVLLLTIINIVIPIYRYYRIRQDILAIMIPTIIAFGISYGLILIINLIFPRKIKFICIIFLFIVSLLSLFLNVGLFFQFGEVFDTSFATLALVTTVSECKDFIIQYHFYIITMTLLFIIINVVGLWLLGKKTKFTHNTYISIGCLLFLPLAFVYLVRADFSFYFYHLSFMQDLFFINQAVTNLRYYNDCKDEMKEQHPTITFNEPKTDNVVLIIGESMTRNYCSSYGFTLNTTPYLKQACEKQSILRFSDVISPDKVTVGVVPKLLTISENAKDWIHATCLINIFKEAKFDTYWFSNQEFVGIFSSMFPALYNCCNHVYFTRYGASDAIFSYDGAILPILKKNLPKDGRKKFVVIHLIGSHMAYNSRFPETFKQFKKNDIQNKFGQEKIVSDYLNSIFYNDHLIGEIIDYFKDSNTALVYVPDHGEEVYDIIDFAGRGVNITKNMIEVPFYLWLSDAFIRSNPDKKKELLKYLDRPYISSFCPHAIMDLSGVHSNEYNEKRSLFSPAYQKLENRKVLGINYDLELKDKRVKVRARN